MLLAKMLAELQCIELLCIREIRICYIAAVASIVWVDQHQENINFLRMLGS
jgi:hypothetical protein